MDNFKQIRIIGATKFGNIYECKKLDTGKLYAMKRLNKLKIVTSDAFKKITCDRDILSAMHSPFVITLKYAFVDVKYCYLILDLMNGGNLKQHLNKCNVFTEERTKFHAAEILLGLQHMHDKGIIFRNLKLENILLDKCGHCKISNFGGAVQLPPENNGMIRGRAGTAGYVAPEAVIGLFYNEIADYFSFGVLIYRCLSGSRPFQRRSRNGSHNIRALDRNVVEMEPEFNPKYFNPYARSIIKGLLCKKVINRLGFHGIMEIKQHAWFDYINFHSLEIGNLSPPFIPNDIQPYQKSFFKTITDNESDSESDTFIKQDDEISHFIHDLFDEFEYPQNLKVSINYAQDIDDDETVCFKPGDIVKITNLTDSSQYNDNIAEVVGYFLEDTQRWPVQIIKTDTQLAIKTKNLTILSISNKISNEYKYYHNYDESDKKLFFVLCKWVKLISLINIGQLNARHYDFIFDCECITLIRAFLGQYLTFYAEIFKLFELCNYNCNVDNVRGIEYYSDQFVLKLFLDGETCVYQNENGIWYMEGDQLFIVCENENKKTISKKFDVWILMDELWRVFPLTS